MGGLCRPAVDFYETARQKGKTMGFYACAKKNSEGESTRYYRLQQWECWRISKGGAESSAGFWSYSDNRSARPWNQLAGGTGRNWCLAYLDDTSATGGKHWLAVFEGAQDYERLLMLKRRIAALRKAGRDDPALTEAGKLLEALPSEVISAVKAGETALHTGESGLVWNSGGMNACDTGRQRALDALKALK